MDPYFTLTKSPSVCDDIMREFGVAAMACSPTGHIINGHTPVKTTSSEQPIRAEGRSYWSSMAASAALTIPRRVSPAIRSSRARAAARLRSHRAFDGCRALAQRESSSETNRFDQADRHRMVSDTDTGAKIRSQMQDLRRLPRCI